MTDIQASPGSDEAESIEREILIYQSYMNNLIFLIVPLSHHTEELMDPQ